MWTPPPAGCTRLRTRTRQAGRPRFCAESLGIYWSVSSSCSLHFIGSLQSRIVALLSERAFREKICLLSPHWLGKKQINQLFTSRGSGATTQQVSKRLQSELMTLMMSGDKVGLKISLEYDVFTKLFLFRRLKRRKYGVSLSLFWTDLFHVLTFSPPRAFLPSQMVITCCPGLVRETTMIVKGNSFGKFQERWRVQWRVFMRGWSTN